MAKDSEMSLNWYRVPSKVLLSPRSHSTVSLLLVEASAGPEAVDCITSAPRQIGAGSADTGVRVMPENCCGVLTGGAKAWEVARRPVNKTSRAILDATDTPDDGIGLDPAKASGLFSVQRPIPQRLWGCGSILI